MFSGWLTAASSHVNVFIVALLAHWFDFLKGSIIGVLLGLFEKFVLRRSVTPKFYAVFLLVLAWFACYQAWLDQYTSPRVAASRH